MQQTHTSVQITRLSQKQDHCGRVHFRVSALYYETCNTSASMFELHSERALYHPTGKIRSKISKSVYLNFQLC